MRSGICLVLCLCLSLSSRADTLRVGNQVLVTGDSAARVIELLGQPAHKAMGSVGAGARQQKKGAKGRGRRSKQASGKVSAKDAEGQRWQYRRGRRTVTIVLVQGRVARIE